MADDTDTRPPEGRRPSEELLQAVADALGRVTVRTFSIDVQGRRLWIKQKAEHKGNRWHGVQKVLAAILAEPLLTPTLPLAGAAGLAMEAQRLRAMAAAGARVPDVVAETDEWIALGDLGQPLEWALDGSGDQAQRKALLEQAADALSAMHRSGLWHGAPFVRNMAVDARGIGFFDVEESVEGSMSDAEGMARDFVLFLFSATRYVEGEALVSLALRYGAEAPDAIWPCLRHLGRKAGILAALLRPFANRMGRDIRQGLAAVDALRALLAER